MRSDSTQVDPPAHSGVPGKRDELPPAIVIGLDSMQGLQTARILRDRGVPVIAVAGDRHHHACRTNACRRIVFADTATGDLIQVLREIGATLPKKAVLVPCQDESVRIVSRHRAALREHFLFSLPAPEVVESLTNKDAFYAHARRLGLPVPSTFHLSTREDALRVAQEMPFPCLLKPAARTPTWDRHTRFKVFKVASAQEFIERYDECRPWAESLVAQQWVEGDDTCLYSCNCYLDAASRPLVAFVARKLRQWPPEVGSSCLGEEVRNDVVLETTLSLFRQVGLRGLGYLEMKRDARTGQHFVIEPNIGRPTGRSAIAEAGGVPLLFTMYCDIVGLPLPENRTQRYGGAKWVDLRHDLQSAFLYWRRGQLTFRDWYRSIRGRKAYAVLSWRDPAPFFADLKGSVAKLLFKRRRRREPRSPSGDE